MKKHSLRSASSSFSVDYGTDLNPEQYAAVMHETGPALVLAGAGTGKTRVVTYRVARLIEGGVRPENILLLTFTNKAAREMMQRAERLMGRNIAGLFGGTFHHVANAILRRHARLAGYARGFSILDREDCRALIETCIAEVCAQKNVLPKGTVLIEICSLAKNMTLPVREVVLGRFPHFSGVLAEMEEVVARYEKKKNFLNLADFDDLLVKWKHVFAENDSIREYYASKFRYILVDEYQDTNTLQAEIVDLIAGGDRNLMVVGDDAQSIYSFRGADFENILRFPEKYHDASVFTLITNYRSTPEILSLANAVISGNRAQFRKELRSSVTSGDTPGVAALRDIFEEAAFVSAMVAQMNSGAMSPDEIAVLYRSHYQSMQIQMEFQRKGIPFEVRSGLKFFEQAHIKDILAYLRISANPRDEISWKRVLRLIPGIGAMTAGRFWKHVGTSENPVDSASGAVRLIPKKAREGFARLLHKLETLGAGEYSASPSASVEYILRQGYEDHLHENYPNAETRIEDIEQLASFALTYDSVEAFLTDMSLLDMSGTDAAEDEDTQGRVVLSTVHQAKGLEWDVVFVVGMNEGRFPSAKSLKNDDEEEERRLFYVGATRARKRLILCYPVSGEEWSGGGFLRPSRFLRELPRHCFEEIVVADRDNEYNSW